MKKHPQGMTKPLLIGLSAAGVVLLLVLGWLLFFRNGNPNEFRQSINKAEGNTLEIDNSSGAVLQIVTADIDYISVNLEGPPSELRQVRFFRTNDDTIKFRYSDGRLEGSVTGIIIVPSNVSIDLTNLINQNVIVQDDRGNRLYTPSGFNNIVGQNTIDYNADGSIQITGAGTVQAENPDSPGVDSSTPFINPNPIGEVNLDEGGGGTPNTNPYGDNPIVPDNPPPPPPQCSVGSQAVKDQCCFHVYHNTPGQSCPGTWVYNNSLERCNYECYDGTTPESDDPDPVTPPSETPVTDPISLACSKQTTINGQDVCCDDNLAHELHIGPRPGYPDCIGRWYFNEKAFECQFRCSDFGEMQDILNELRERKANEEL